MPRRSMKRAARRPRKRVARKAAPRKAMVALIKKTVMKVAETKKTQSALVPVTILHNVPQIISTNLTAVSATTATPGFNDVRIGDSVQAIGIQFRFLFMTYSDRPNVTFKVWVIRTPAYDGSRGVYPYTYATWFDARTSQWVMDDINKENITVVKQMTFKPPVSDTSQESGSALHETSYVRKMYLPLNRTLTYQDEGVSTSPPTSHTKQFAYQLLVAAYDTYSTLITDFAGKMLIQHSFHYKDF